MRRNWIRITLAVGLILLPIALYWYTTRLPEKIRFAVGPQFGLYSKTTKHLAEQIREVLRDRYDHEVEVELIVTEGSVENLRLLQEGIADFALYQSGTERFVDGTKGIFDQLDTDGDRRLTLAELQAHRDDPTAEEALRRLNVDHDDESLTLEEFSNTPSEVRFVANTHSDVAHLLVRSDRCDIEVVHELIESGATVSTGRSLSGDYAISRFFQRSLKRSYPDPKLELKQLAYEEVKPKLEDGTIHGAFIMAGVGAELFDTLFGAADSRFQLLPLPFAPARATDNVPVYEYTIRKGQHRSGRNPIPPRDIESIALRAQLLTRRDVNHRLVKIVTETVLSHDFMQQNNLGELLEGGHEFARKNPEFLLHSGAEKVYDPDLHPWVSTDFVESTEGIRSFIVSVIIAAFFGLRWIRERRKRRTAHRLDRYIHSLLDIERRQAPLDQDSGGSDLERLQRLLDEVTALRQDALGEISAHELNEERGAACFVDMCHELSQKINAKLTRQSMERQFARLAGAISRIDGRSSSSGGQNEER